MTPTRLRECLDAIGWTQRGLARMLGRQEVDAAAVLEEDVPGQPFAGADGAMDGECNSSEN